MSIRHLVTFLTASFLFIVVLLVIAANKDRLYAAVKDSTYKPHVRTYYIAAENTVWDYAPSGMDLHTGGSVPEPWGVQTKYQKVRYFEYTDNSFTKRKSQPQWLGILGPIIRGVQGDTIHVVFYNRADKPYSMHPHGVFYDKDNEGAMHSMTEGDESMQHTANETIMPYGSDAKGSSIAPGEKYTYVWKVRDEAAPTDAEGGSKIWMYHSHVRSPEDIYEGLIGSMIITSKQHANADGTPDDIDREFVTLFMIFDESQEGMTDDETEGSLKHAINGYIFGNLKGLGMKKGEKVRWHLIGLGNEVDLHTPHWHGNIVKEKGYATDVLELLPASMKTVDMDVDSTGEWMYHCHVSDHITAGMMASYFVR